MTRITSHIHRIRDTQLQESDTPVTLSDCIETFLADRDAMADFADIRSAVDREWLRSQFRTALREAGDADAPNLQLELLPQAMPMALSLGTNESGSSSWIGTPKATREHLKRARAIRKKHIVDSQQKLENFDENCAILEPAFDAGARNVTEALGWIAKHSRDAA